MDWCFVSLEGVWGCMVKGGVWTRCRCGGLQVVRTSMFLMFVWE